MTRKHVIITKLFEFGGSNTHLKTLINYFGKQNVILILEDTNQLLYLKSIEPNLLVKIKPNLHSYAHLNYPSILSNLKELVFILKSILDILFLSIKHDFADVTISAVEPEKHLYFLWLPYIKVTYILHSTPSIKYTSFTAFTCNSKLGNQKKIITVSNSNKKLICENWDLSDKKKPFINVIYNTIIECDPKNLDSSFASKSADQRYVVTLGHVTDYKNPDIWLEVAKLVTSMRVNVQFLWFGGGPLLNYFQETAQKINRVSFLGMTTNADNYLKTATLYYQPSLYETQGIAVLEAMYNKLPCVVANIGGLPESVQNKHNGILVDPRNIQENVDAIIHLLDNDELRLLYGLNSYNRYQELFTYTNFKAKMDAI